MNIREFIDKFIEALEIEGASSVTSETEFRNLDDWSSLSVMMLIAMFDDKFNKEITGEDIKTCITVADLYNFAIK